jgi:hypothetical protein
MLYSTLLPLGDCGLQCNYGLTLSASDLLLEARKEEERGKGRERRERRRL